MELMRISPADVVRLALPQREIYKLEDEAKSGSDSAHKGKQQHETLLKEALLRKGLALPGFEQTDSLIRAANNLVLFPEDQHDMILGGNVVASTRVDMVIGDEICGEIKPFLKGRHALQLMLTAMIYAISAQKEKIDGILYFYGKNVSPNIMVLPSGGAEFWEDGRNLCMWAAEIYYQQRLIDKQKELQKRQEVTGKKGERVFSEELEWKANTLDRQHSVVLRRQFDECITRIKSPLVKLLRG